MSDQNAEARDKALSLLADMDRTERQICDRLAKAGFEEEVITETVSFLREYHFVDDARYAENYLDYYKDKRSKMRIRMDLRKKGIREDDIDRTFTLLGDYDERPLITRLGRKKLATLKEADPRRRQKVITFLAGKGFRMEDIFDVLEEIFTLTDEA
ncbi:MAG: regulatory protein RecX [Lachnospiraceae bacterium]|nr:regulatory protein RecX [Lachnospiraceae bacterium]